jgi:UDP-N-acetylglucosamine 2-epimerase (non-hydrolysing)
VPALRPSPFAGPGRYETFPTRRGHTIKASRFASNTGRDTLKIAAIVGARPNFVKIAPIVAELRTRSEASTALIHTGQHYDGPMSDAFFANLELPDPDVNLHVKAASATAQIAEIMLRLEPVLADVRPDLVVVVGDVNSTLAGALTASKLGLRLAHVEAGLRSFDRTMPEEINRVLTDSMSDLLFTTEPAANENLAREGIPGDRVHFVGNVMIDTLIRYRERARESSILEALSVESRGYSLLTLHRPSNVDTEDALRPILGAVAQIQAESPVVFPVHPRTRGRLEPLIATMPAMTNLRLVDPLPYLAFLKLMANARCVLTDSGGIQEETTALGVPCLTLRENTERPITVSRGTNRVIGVDPHAIYTHWRRAADGEWPIGELPELWDGHAARRIVNILLATL